MPPTEVVPSSRRVYRLSALGTRPEADILWQDPLARRLFRAMLMSESSK